jgi:uncharacterized protein DUF6812
LLNPPSGGNLLKVGTGRPDTSGMSAEIRRERVVLETERYTIVGDVTLPAEGFHSRLSDLLNREGMQFIALVDATISGRDGEAPVQRPFIAVARDHVQLAYEA